jgi:hypothetical protein
VVLNFALLQLTASASAPKSTHAVDDSAADFTPRSITKCGAMRQCDPV